MPLVVRGPLLMVLVVRGPLLMALVVLQRALKSAVIGCVRSKRDAVAGGCCCQ